MGDFNTAGAELSPWSTPDHPQGSAYAGVQPEIPAAPGDPVRTRMSGLQQSLDRLRSQQTARGQDVESRRVRRAAIEPELAAIRQQAAELRAALSTDVEQSEFFRDIQWNNVWSPSRLWGPKAEAMQRRMDLAREVDGMIAQLKSEGVEDEHETMQALKSLRTDATPNYAARTATNTVDLTSRRPVTAAIVGAGVLAGNWVLKKAMGSAGDHWLGRLLRWTGVAFAAGLFVNHFTEKDRAFNANRAAADAANQPPSFDASAEAYAHNLDDPNNPRYAWMRQTPAGTVEFRYPGPPNMPVPPFQQFGPPAPYRPLPPMPVNPGMYFRPDVFTAPRPGFMPQGYGPQNGPVLFS